MMNKEMSRHILIFGANSAMARETAKLYAGTETSFFLVSRDADKLSQTADDLRARGCRFVETYAVDFEDFDRHEEVVRAAVESLGRIDIVLFAHGLLGDQESAENNYKLADRIYRVNFLSVVSLMTPLTKVLKEQRSGKIIAISSVAGDRGRQSNFIYGSAKGALSIYCQGLRNRLHPFGVEVLVVKPGFVDTPMTADFPKNPLFVGPDVIARGIVKAADKSGHEVYLPFYWRFIMLVIRCVPEFVFKRMKL